MGTNSIGSLLAKSDGGSTGVSNYMTLTVKEWELPNEFKEPMWKLNQAEKYLKLFNEATQELFEQYYPKELEEHWDIEYDKAECKIDIDDDLLVCKMGKISSNFMDKLIVFDCIIVSKSDINLSIDTKIFRCGGCNALYDSRIKKCPTCESKNITFSRVDSKLIDVEFMTVQERQDDMMIGTSTTPKQLELIVKGSLTKRFKAGDNVRVTGIVKSYSNISDEKLNKEIDNNFVDTITFKFIVDVHNIQHTSTSQDMIIANPSTYITEHDQMAILGLRKKYMNDIDLLNILTNSFAPHIFGHQIIKQSILIQSVGSAMVKGQRNNINIFIVGDPGIGKSKLLEAATKINLHSARAVGKGASGVGLTASVTKDDKGMPRLSIGAAVLADKGLCVIDELSNISDEHKAHLLECMENGTFTVNKHGINQTLNARAAFLIASNPDSGKYSSYNSLKENISLSPQLFSRFDIIFVVLDNVNKDEDQKLRVHLTAIYNNEEPPKAIESNTDRISEDLLKKYLVYAKINNIDNIKISKEAYQRFDNFHDDLRTPVRSSDITATPRQYEGMLRISMALSRLLLKSEVTEEMADYVIKLLNIAYESTGMKLGNSTGLNQIAIYSKDLTKMSKEKAFVEVMINLTNDNKNMVDREDTVLELMDKLHIPQSEAYRLFDKMLNNGKILTPERGKYLLDV